MDLNADVGESVERWRDSSGAEHLVKRASRAILAGAQLEAFG